MLKTPINRENFEVETQRLKLQPITLQYADTIFSELIEDITQYMVIKPPKEVQETKDFIIGAIERNIPSRKIAESVGGITDGKIEHIPTMDPNKKLEGICYKIYL